jgi:hypothetical protein
MVAGTVVVAKPCGSARRNVVTALRAAADGRGITEPLGRKAMVNIWPFLVNRVPFAADTGMTVPFVEVGEGHISIMTIPGFEPHFVTPSLKFRAGPGSVATVVVVVVLDDVVVVPFLAGFVVLVLDVLVGVVVVVVVLVLVLVELELVVDVDLPSVVLVVVVVVVGTGTAGPGTLRVMGDVDLIVAPSMRR